MTVYTGDEEYVCIFTNDYVHEYYYNYNYFHYNYHYYHNQFTEANNAMMIYSVVVVDVDGGVKLTMEKKKLRRDQRNRTRIRSLDTALVEIRWAV